MTRDFGKCKTVFFDCMDEFCANKDAQLKRCACSTRANEFTATQKSLDNAEDKLLDFSQRLLHVNMDPDDAAVINRASEGEAAYYATADKTASKKTKNYLELEVIERDQLREEFNKENPTSLGVG